MMVRCSYLFCFLPKLTGKKMSGYQDENQDTLWLFHQHLTDFDLNVYVFIKGEYTIKLLG